MKIFNTVPYFFNNFLPTEQFLKQYHEKFEPHFREYFLYHCKNREEKIRRAIQKYPEKLKEIEKSSEKIEHLIQKVISDYQQKYNVEFTKDVHIIVGAYGSNAFTHRQIIPEVTFCLEKLSPKDEHLKVIIAHEFGHVLHNILSAQDGMDWSKLEWFHPYTWLLQEGCATYFSKQVVSADEAVYFSYDGNGEKWMKFADDNKQQIFSAFLEDIKQGKSATEIFLEWFSINGGARFGHSRLGYYIGYCAVQRLIEKYHERKAVTLWKEMNFVDEMDKVLLGVVK